MRFPCPCCGYLTFYETPSGTFKICPVCFWEDDNTQNENSNYEGGANGISLNQAKKNFAILGAIQEKFVGEVRKPLPNEIPGEIGGHNT